MKKLLLLLLVLSTGICAFAQNNEDSALLKKLVEKQVLTQQEADEIVKENAEESKAIVSQNKLNKVREAFNTPYMKFGGYGLFLYRYSDVQAVKHNAEARAVYLHMQGKLFNNISYFVLADFVNPLVHEFYLDWTPAKQFNLRVGEFKTSFSIENQLSATDLETVYNSRTISSLVGMGDDVMKLQNGRNNGGRDVGVRASGSLLSRESHDLIEYSLGLFQGSGISSSEQNNSKDFSGMLLFQPIKGFRIGGGAYFGEATYSVSGFDRKDHVRNRWIISSDYHSDRFSARAEWIRGNDGGISREGVYGMGSYYVVPNKINTVARVDYYNQNKQRNEEMVDCTFAVNYYFYPRCRVQLNYTHSAYSAKWDARDSNSVLTQLQIVF